MKSLNGNFFKNLNFDIFKRRKTKREGLDFKDLIDIHYTNTDVSHAYETLKNNIFLSQPGTSQTSLLVTSAQPFEGKTTVTLNLGVAMMLARKRVLLIDTDLRKPRLHQVFHVSNELGFADLLAGTHTPESLVQPVVCGRPPETDSHTLHVVPCGQVSADSLKLFGSDHVQKALDSYAQNYDAIILDTPPVLAISDPLSLAPMVRGVLLVLNAGVTTEAEAIDTKARIEQAGGKILGVVMNRFNEKKHGSGLNSYFHHYGALYPNKR